MLIRCTRATPTAEQKHNRHKIIAPVCVCVDFRDTFVPIVVARCGVILQKQNSMVCMSAVLTHDLCATALNIVLLSNRRKYWFNTISMSDSWRDSVFFYLFFSNNIQQRSRSNDWLWERMWQKQDKRNSYYKTNRQWNNPSNTTRPYNKIHSFFCYSFFFLSLFACCVLHYYFIFVGAVVVNFLFGIGCLFGMAQKNRRQNCSTNLKLNISYGI